MPIDANASLRDSESDCLAAAPHNAPNDCHRFLLVLCLLGLPVCDSAQVPLRFDQKWVTADGQIAADSLSRACICICVNPLDLTDSLICLPFSAIGDDESRANMEGIGCCAHSHSTTEHVPVFGFKLKLA